MNQYQCLFAMGRRIARIKNAVALRVVAGDTSSIEQIAQEETEKENAKSEDPREAMEAYLTTQTEKHLPT